ncbi:MAG: heavy metal transport/detoxification protein [Muribaculaceae bacterium]|nr:heavy metal transport/detoxification protein [Muribaculaceae bacterium]
MQFKTNAKCAHCQSAILEAMRSRFPNAEWNLDLQSADKVLSVHGLPEDAQHEAQVIKTLEETGFKGSRITSGIEND